jgi:DNA repair exonuclease SbcCD ATPase subunit
MLDGEIIDIHTEITEFNDVSDKIRNINELKFKIQHNNSAACKELHFFEGNDSCPTCTQLIEKTFKDRKISDLSTKTEEYEQALLTLESRHITLDKKYTAMLNFKDKLKRNHAEVLHQNSLIARNEKSMSKIYSEIQRLSESPDIAKMKGKLEVYQEEFDSLERKCSDVSKRKSELDVVSNLLKDSGIKARVIKKYIPVINNRINRYLTSMDFYVNFTLDEEFNEVIKSRYRDEFSYSSFSEGEKQKIDLALLFTWREIAHMKNSVSTNLLLLDEVFDSSLDASSTEDLLKILKSIDKDTNIFVISHKGDILTDKFHTNIMFDKVSDFSKIVSSADNDI